jgi:hypothetical protein
MGDVGRVSIDPTKASEWVEWGMDEMGYEGLKVEDSIGREKRESSGRRHSISRSA